MCLNRLPLDLCEEILVCLRFTDVCHCRSVCRAWRAVADDIDWAMARHYASAVLGDASFWETALHRPVIFSSPSTGWLSLARIRTFARILHERLDAPMLYELWTTVVTPSPTYALHENSSISPPPLPLLLSTPRSSPRPTRPPLLLSLLATRHMPARAKKPFTDEDLQPLKGTRPIARGEVEVDVNVDGFVLIVGEDKGQTTSRSCRKWMYARGDERLIRLKKATRKDGTFDVTWTLTADANKKERPERPASRAIAKPPPKTTTAVAAASSSALIASCREIRLGRSGKQPTPNT